MAKAVKKKSAKEASNTFHNIMAASVKDNPKPKKKKGTEVTEVYTLPFDTSFDWRVTLFQVLKDLSNEAILEVTQKLKETDANIDWRSEELTLRFAIENDLPKKIVDIMIRNGQEQYDI